MLLNINLKVLRNHKNEDIEIKLKLELELILSYIMYILNFIKEINI